MDKDVETQIEAPASGGSPTITLTEHQPPEKKYQVEFDTPPADKPEPESKPKAADTDDVRAGLAGAAPTIFGFLKRETKEAKEAKEKKAKPDKAEKTESTPDDVRAEKLLGKKPAKPAAAAEAPKLEPVVAPQLTAHDIANVAAQTAAQVVQQSKQAEPALPEPEYPEDYQQNAQVFDYMARSNPAKYGNIKAQLAEFGKKEQEYRALWEAQNEGETFDPDSDDHATFYNKNTPNIDEKDLDRAEQAIEDDRISGIVNQRVSEQLQRTVTPLVQQRAEEQLRPTVDRQSRRFAAAALQAVLPDVDLDKLTPEVLAQIEETSPRQTQIINNAAARASQVGETYLKIVNQMVTLDETNPIHREAVDVVSRVQNFILSRPRDERLRQDAQGNAVDYMPIERYVGLPQAQRAKYWTVGPEEVSRQLEMDAGSMASKVWDQERQVLEKYGVKFNNGSSASNGGVRKTSQATPTPEPTQYPERVKVNVSRGMSERGGAGLSSDVVSLNPKGAFAKLMEGLRPARLRQQ